MGSRMNQARREERKREKDRDGKRGGPRDRGKQTKNENQEPRECMAAI